MTADELAREFNAAHAEFDKLTPTVWGPAGQALTFQLGLRPGDAVLDVCCGMGASALPAAAAVGPAGLVHAIDLADDLLEQGRVIAAERALLNVEFVCADATTWEPPSTVPEAGYDALACSYGVFFLPDMDISFARLTGLVRHGGKIGVTAWRAGALEDYVGAFFEVADRYRPVTAQREHPGSRWPNRAKDPLARIDTPDKLRTWLTDFGTHSVDVNELSNLIPATEEFSWNLVLGSGLRGALVGLDAAAIEAVRIDFLGLLVERAIHIIDVGTLVGTAVVRRPSPT